MKMQNMITLAPISSCDNTPSEYQPTLGGQKTRVAQERVRFRPDLDGLIHGQTGPACEFDEELFMVVGRANLPIA
jgi:hypothetical protein